MPTNSPSVQCIWSYFYKDRMNSIHSRQFLVNFSRSRRAIVQPRFLFAMTAMASAVGGISYLATAQTGRAPVKMTAPNGATSSKPKTLADLPAMVEAYGQSRLLQRTAVAAKAGDRSIRNVGTGQSGFNLVETDLTPNSFSDDREPTYSPGGDFIAFASNGKDANGDGRIDSDGFNAEGKFHIWVMNRDGSHQRQVTGVAGDNDSIGTNQRRPSWAPDGKQLAYINGDGGQSELYVTEPFTDTNGNGGDGIQVGAASRRTFFNPGANATLLSPAWSPSGERIIFAANANLDNDTGDNDGRSFNLFAISPTGDVDTLARLTGGSKDTTPGASATAVVDDLNPAFAINSNVIYYSSNRTKDSVLNVRRIWRTFGNGTGKVQVTDPLKRSNGRAEDSDDFPTASLRANVQRESISFQTTTSLDSSDVPANGGANDLNIWSLPLSSNFPTPFVETEPRLFVSNFNGNRLENVNPVTGGQNTTFQGTFGVTNPEGVVVRGRYVYVSNRGQNQISRIDQESGVFAPSFGVGSSFTAPNSVPMPTDLISDGTYLYVGSAGPSGTPATTKAIYRFTLDGAPAGTDPGNGDATVRAAFSSGDTSDAAKIGGGTEGLAFSAGNNRAYIYTSVFSEAKVNVYQRDSGLFVKTIVAKGDGGLATPTGLIFGPDLNGDGYSDLYVNSSGTDDVKAYAGPNPNDINAMVGLGSNTPAGTYITDVVSDDNGNQTNLNAPEGIKIITRDDGIVQIFVSSFGNKNTDPGTGDHINRYFLDPSKFNPADLNTLTATPAGSPPFDATYLQIGGARGLGYFDFNQLARDSLASRSGQPAPTPTPVPSTATLEGFGAAQVVTNVLSSPANYAASGIKPQTGNDNVGQDKAPDVEPTYSRLSTTPQDASRLAFASTRRFAPQPSSNQPDANGKTPSASNPFGSGSDGSGGTFDIWGTSTDDTTPPALTPQAVGNQLIPVVAPGPQAPFFAPRTVETGLKAGGEITVAVVLSELESGIDDSAGSGAVTALFYRAGAEQFDTAVKKVNEGIPVAVKTELRPPVESVVSLQPYDDGPISQGGHEAQANAVAGDGLYYCVGKTTTSATPGDFYIDISVVDRKFNGFNYDNIWGFSTQRFQKRSSTSNLFVSDYTTGQLFTSQLTNNAFVADNRFNNEFSVESYFLTNNGGQPTDGLQSSFPTTFTNVDTWRILSRGPVPSTTIDAYKPRITQQIDPNSGSDPTFTKKTRNVAVADSFIVWAAPFAANSFVGPGTITDATTQNNLTKFLEAGGRLFVTGRDVAFALSNGSSSNNDFLGNELGASLANEVFTNNIDLVGGIGNGFIDFGDRYPDTFYSLQIADRVETDATKNDLYSDGALTQQPTTSRNDPNNNGVGVRMDTITATGGDTTPVYAIAGATVGQKIAHTRANGLQSRTVFFSFGLEGVNRRYRKSSPGLPLTALDTRARIAAGLARYFKTNRIGGIVINDKTNLPIPNFLVRVTAGGETFLARTDEKGNYELSGLPEGGYTVEPAFLLNGRLVPRNTAGAQTDPAGFFGGTPVFVFVTGGSVGIGNLRPIPVTPGTIRGRIVTSKGTPKNFNDDKVIDQKAVGLTVLLRSPKPTSLTKNGGRYAQLTKTSFDGSFNFSNVPAGLQLEVVFNPRVDDPATSVDEGDIPIESGLRANYAGPKTDVGRRVIPDARRAEPIIAPIGNTYVLNDPDPVKYPDPEKGPAAGTADSDNPTDSGVPIVVPEGANVSGVVSLNGLPFKGARVELFKVEGTKLTSQSVTSTSPDGLYSFKDVLAGTYVVRATVKLRDGVEVTDSSPQLVINGQDKTYDFKLFLAKVSGLVTLNGKPTSGILVQLLDKNGNQVVLTGSNGQPFNLTRTATTNSGTTTNYELLNVPAGTYTVRASLGGASGTASITVGNNQNVVVPTINLVPQKLSGVVNLSIDGVSQGPLAGAQVELLDANGQPFNPPTTVVTDNKGAYNFPFISAGTYQVRATYKGATSTSASFTLSNGTDPMPGLTINLQTVTVTVLNPRGTPESGVGVTLSQGGVVLQTGTTDANGQVKFIEVPAGTYAISATKGDLGNTLNKVVVTNGKALTISLSLFLNGGGSVTYAANGIYSISIPFDSDGTGLTVDQAFSQPLSSQTHKIYFFDAPNQVNRPTTMPLNQPNAKYDYKEITSGRYKLRRGQGYVLQTFNKSISTRTPAQNRDLKPFNGTTFTIPLFANPTFLSDTGEPDNRNNGYNLIGFPFDPQKFRRVAFTDAQVMYGSTLYETIDKAAAAGIISRQLYTLDERGVRVVTNDVNLLPFVGYFVRILRNDQPVKLILRNPQ